MVALLAGDERHTVVLSGHQAGGTPGGWLAAGRRTFAIGPGQPLEVRCRIETLTWKVHPDFDDLLGALPSGGGSPKVIIYGCGRKAADAVAARLGDHGFRAIAPGPGDTIEIESD
jgi:Cft2 family RNA processing exonuclease